MPIAKITLCMLKKPALCRFSNTVVIPKPIKPNGAGFAVLSLVLTWMACCDMANNFGGN